MDMRMCVKIYAYVTLTLILIVTLMIWMDKPVGQYSSVDYGDVHSVEILNDGKVNVIVDDQMLSFNIDHRSKQAMVKTLPSGEQYFCMGANACLKMVN